MKSMLTLFAIVSPIVLMGCGLRFENPFARGTPDYCVCPGEPGRVGNSCSSEPFDGTIQILLDCRPNQATRALTSQDGETHIPFCVYRLTTTDLSVVDVFPPHESRVSSHQRELTIVDTPSNDLQRFWVPTRARIPSGSASATVEVSAELCRNFACTETERAGNKATVTVSNNCS